jgi:DNA-binding beta-propeller fold protein YncE
MRRLLAALVCSLPLAAQSLRLEKTIPLTGVEGRIDHFAVDVQGRRLFMAALGANSVEVIDTQAGKVAHSIRGLREPQGVFYWPEGNRLYVANAADGKVRVFDGSSYAPLREYDFNSDPDNIRFDPKQKEVFVGYGNGALGVIGAKVGDRVGQTMLDAHPESFQLEQNGPRIFVNVPAGTNALKIGNVSVIDRRTRTVIAKWPVDAKQNFPMALDEPNHRLFVGCRKPAKLIVLDTADGRPVASLDIVGDTDDLYYDATLKRIYVSGGAGAVSVIEQKDPDHYEPLATIPTASGARTSLWIPEFKRLYVAVPHRGKQAAALLEFAAAP